MKINFDKKKIAEATAEIVHKTLDTSKKVASGTKKNVGYVVEKAKDKSLSQKLKKLNPVFPEQYNSEEFKLPNIIMIVDDATRRKEKMCDGAIGYLKNDKGVEIFCLYDEEIEFSRIQFIPAAVCDSVYYVDSFDRNKFIRTDCIFSKAYEEKVAELEHVAYCLGAKRCSIEISEVRTDASARKRNASVSKGKVAETAEINSVQSSSDVHKGKEEIEFDGNTNCIKPELKWFSYDDGIKRLIEMRMDKTNSIKSKTLELSGASTSIMSRKIASAIDGAVKGGMSLTDQAEREQRSKLIFHIEF